MTATYRLGCHIITESVENGMVVVRGRVAVTDRTIIDGVSGQPSYYGRGTTRARAYYDADIDADSIPTESDRIEPPVDS